MDNNDNPKEEKTYKCGSCGDESKEAGTCCEALRKEKCEGCNEAKKDDGSCSC